MEPLQVFKGSSSSNPSWVLQHSGVRTVAFIFRDDNAGWTQVPTNQRKAIFREVYVVFLEPGERITVHELVMSVDNGERDAVRVSPIDLDKLIDFLTESYSVRLTDW